MHKIDNRNNAPAGAVTTDRPWSKRESRSPAWLDSFVLSRNGREVPVVLTNISTRGCRIRASEPLPLGEQVGLKVPRLGRLTAQIVWAEGGDAGAEFVLGTDIWEEEASDVSTPAAQCG